MIIIFVKNEIQSIWSQNCESLIQTFELLKVFHPYWVYSLSHLKDDDTAFID